MVLQDLLIMFLDLLRRASMKKKEKRKEETFKPALSLPLNYNATTMIFLLSFHLYDNRKCQRI